MDPSFVRLIRRAGDGLDPASLPSLPPPDRLLMAEPTFYERAGPPTRHSDAPVDRFVARRQWRELLRTYQGLGLAVTVLPGQPLLPGYVFCADAVLPTPPGLLSARPSGVRSIMRSAHREPEVAHVVAALEAQGVLVEALNPYEVPQLSGSGDGIWHLGRALLYAGLGADSSAEAWLRVGAMTGVPVVLLELSDRRFDRLDRCLAVIDERTAVFAPDAFDVDGLALLRRGFERRVEVSAADALRGFCGGHCPDGRHYIVQGGADAAGALRALDVDVVEVESSEFAKTGGSVARMTLRYWGV